MKHLITCLVGCEFCGCHCHDLGGGTVHTMPVNDLIEHDLSSDCICGPDTEHVPNPNGPDGWLITHHSLDGREHHEETR